MARDDIKAATPTVRKIVRMLENPDGVTATEIQKRTGESKRRSKYSLSKLAERFDYKLDHDKWEGYPLKFYRFVEPTARRKVARKPR